MIEITEAVLDALRDTVKGSMSPKRFRHTAAVEDMVARLCALYCPEHTHEMRAAALLHDLTKELNAEEQISLCHRYGLAVTAQDLLSPKTFHARTAEAKIRQDLPQLATPLILNAVRWHTTGREDMTLTEQLLYLADYIDESRTFPNCVLLRHFFWDANPAELSAEDRLELLKKTLILSFDMTVRDLLTEGAPIAADTILARNRLLESAKDKKGTD